MKDFGLENRKYVIAGIAVAIVTVYIIRLFMLQVTSDDYKKSADSNAFLKKVEYPSRGVIHDRHGKLMVYNQPAYDIMVIMNEAKDHIDTLEHHQRVFHRAHGTNPRPLEESRLLALHSAAVHESAERP